MIKISTGTNSARIATFITSCFPILIVFIKIGLGQFHPNDIIVDVVIFSLTILVAYLIAYNDYEIWLSKEENCVIMKKRGKTVKYDIDKFLTFKLEYIGLNMSSGLRYYRLKIGNQSYRIRILINKDNKEKFSDTFDPTLYLKKLENIIKTDIRKETSGSL